MSLTIKDFMLSERRCAQLLKRMRWKGGKVRCIYCKSDHIHSNGLRQEHFRRYVCKDCGKYFTEKSGTIFANSFFQLREWFYIARELHRGISINQIAKELGRSYRHVMNASHEIMDSVYMKRLIQLDAEDVEIDEMYQSAGEKGTRQTRREPRKRGLKLRGRGTYDKDKPPIVAVVERGGKVVVEVFHHLNKKNLDAFLYNVTGRFVHTDDFRIYWHLDDDPNIIHVSVNHSKRKYAQSYISTNTVEGLYADLRTWLRRYKGVCKDKLYRFVSLFQFNYNHREMDVMDKFMSFVGVLIRQEG